MLLKKTSHLFALTSLILLVVLVSSLQAQVAPDRAGVGQAEFRAAELNIETRYRTPNELPPQAMANAAADLAALGVRSDAGFVETRGGGWANLMMSRPLLPGRGKGNNLSWGDLGRNAPGNDTELSQAASQAFTKFIEANSHQLRIDTQELSNPGKVTVNRGGAMIQIYMPRVHDGITVRGSYLSASINNGNLTLFGTEKWGDINTSTTPGISESDARQAVQALVEPYQANGSWSKTELILVPVAVGQNPNNIPVGQGLDHRLAWVIRPSFDGDMRHFEALVDAHTGELLSFEDTNQYAATPREVRGGVLPVSNDGVSPDGVEQPEWPMPFDNVTTPSGTVTTDSGGNLPAPVDGDITSNLDGQYVRMNDNCGAISLTSSGDIDFDVSGGTDCTTPGSGGAGNTHASRTGFHELNRIIEMGRSHLPTNNWLQQQLTSNMNINLTCNAFWSPGAGTVNFYRSGGFPHCNNTGEIAGVFDHEWGHGLDDNDAIPSIASPSGEGIADVYAALRLNDSCIGRNFRLTACSGFGDPCIAGGGDPACTGVRDIDYLKRASGQPHDYSWSNANCGSVHCVGAVYAEAVWSLWKRELPAVYSFDDNTAHEIVARLTFIGGGNTGTWFSGGPPNGGCASTSGYMNFLAADDDNGNLNDGTPHMQAIFNAFDDQEIACGTPTVQDSGCSGTPATAPVLTGSPLDKSVSLSWNAIAGASSYDVFRTDGVFGCDFGKEKVGTTAGTTFDDSGLQNNRDYSYVVIPKGSHDACFGPASNCSTISAAAGPNVNINPDSATLTIATGDGDEFFDNCEDASFDFDVDNTGLGTLTNVRITGVTVVSHPATVINTSFPAAVLPSTLAEGATGTGSFDFTGGGLAFGDTVVFEVSVTSDEISPITKTQTISLENAESDLLSIPSQTWDFESDLEGWTVIEGTFNQTNAGSGANSSTGYVASSALLNNQCDQVRSPVFQLTSTSTLSVYTNFDIEDFGAQWWDRANVAIFEDDTRTSVDPSTGRLYNASGAGATCATVGQNGWAGVFTNWASSGWSAADLNSVSLAGKSVQIDVAFGTDQSLVGDGFWFDQMTVTDIELLVADAQTDTCGGNQSPVVTITAPADGSSFNQGVPVGFTGTAIDNENGDISASLAWTSSLDGSIGSGVTVNTTTLSVGVHTITASVTDLDGAPGSDQITVTILNQPPVVTITAPSNGSSFNQGDSVGFTGTAIDPENLDISANLAWTSSLDGSIGSGVTVNTTTLSVGVHTITASVTDLDGAPGSDQITVTILNQPPVVTITAPSNGSSFNQGDSVGFTGTAIDPENLDISANLAWTSSIDGSIGTGGSFSTSSLNAGAHTITAEVTDSDGAPGSDSISVTIVGAGATSVHVASVFSETVNEGRGSKSGRAVVTIVDNLLNPVAGYLVTGMFEGSFTDTPDPAATDSNGTVTFLTTSPPKKGGVTVSFCVSDVDGAISYEAADNEPGTTCGDTPPPPPTGDGTLKGTVKDNSGTKLANVEVQVSDPGGHGGSSNKGGKYSVQNVPAGTWTVTATLAGFEVGSEENVTITAGSTTTVNFSLVPLP